MDIITVVTRFLVAIVCGAIVGWEREIRDKAAGFRTHILVCVGSCLFGLLGASIAYEYEYVDILRLAQGLLVGIGFLGAGVIVREGASVKGLTTAAGIWIMSAIGFAVGTGYYIIAIFGTLFCFLTIVFFGRIEKGIKK